MKSKNYSKSKDNPKKSEWSDTTAFSNEKANDNFSGSDGWLSNNNNNSNKNTYRGRCNGRGRGRGRDRGRGRGGDHQSNSRGRVRNFQKNNKNDEKNNFDNNIEVPENAIEDLFIKGINFEATEEDLKDTFNKYGKISSCKILKDKETQKSKGVGFVKFTDKKSAVCALNDADNLVVKGRNVLIRFANDKEGEFKGKKKGFSGFNKSNESNNFTNDENKRNEDDNRGRGRGRTRGRGRGGDRGGKGGGRGGRGRRDNNNRKNSDNSNSGDNSDNGWGNFNNRERSRSRKKEVNNDEW